MMNDACACSEQNGEDFIASFDQIIWYSNGFLG